MRRVTRRASEPPFHERTFKVSLSQDISGTPHSLRLILVLGAVFTALLLAFQDSVSAKSSPIVGRWQMVRTCQKMVGALQAVGLRPLAPVVVSDYFPNQTPQQLAKKKSLCQGAKPQIHSHFFTAGGKFGSVDQHGEQVDDGTYTVSGSTLMIGPGSFRFRIQGKTLMLKPLLTSALKQEALADPLGFHAAGYMVAVAVPGHPWNRVACRTWC